MATTPRIQEFRGMFDEEGVYFYQAYNDAIADWALEHQKLGGPLFQPERMTWIKPSFAWMLYRAGYGRKPNQGRILRFKLSHEAVAELLSQCKLAHEVEGDRHGGLLGRIQWDPERDLFYGEKREPRKMPRTRAIQIGLKGALSHYFVEHALCIDDVTELAHRVGKAHQAKDQAAAMEELRADLPDERPYLPQCPDEVLMRLAMKPGNAADAIAHLGLGQAASVVLNTKE
eukprot:m.304716 g.304716  ORF g.304716 m.304716 type:complete len:230 (-) comp17240_c0_seq1:253-942(-)